MSGRTEREVQARSFRWRAYLLLGVLACSAVALVWRAVELQLIDKGFLQKRGTQNFSRVIEIASHRGTIVDRYGEPLAVSTPVDSIYANPKELSLASDQFPRLAKALKMNNQELTRRITSNLSREFLYLARHLQPADAQKIKALGIPGVYLMREYRRYYPAGEVAGHVIGFTNIDDVGQEGLELAFDHWLAGEDGQKRIIQDRYGRIVQDVESIRAVRPGRNLALSIDLRIQYLAYRGLKSAIRDTHATSGSVVVLDVQTGEVLAMVNQPSYNPNDRSQLKPGTYRNRAVTDLFEPGSSMKPFVIAAALASGKYHEDSIVDTGPGYVKVGNSLVEEEHGSLGRINLATILAKSSNVGITMVALSLEPKQMWSTFSSLGFGQVTTSGYPGESAGLLTNYANWRPVAISRMSFGYGLSVTPLQLAHAYATVGAQGVMRPISFLMVDKAPAGTQVMDRKVAGELVHLLESVVTQDGGTGYRAAIPGYRVSGKTGTAEKAIAGGYSKQDYMAVFGGIAPATNPRLAAVVVLDSPEGRHQGGEVSAPVFSEVVGGALRLMAVPPDQIVRDMDDVAKPMPTKPTKPLQTVQR